MEIRIKVTHVAHLTRKGWPVSVFFFISNRPNSCSLKLDSDRVTGSEMSLRINVPQEVTGRTLARKREVKPFYDLEGPLWDSKAELGGQFPAIVRHMPTSSELALGGGFLERKYPPFPQRLAGILFCRRARKEVSRHPTSPAASSHRLPAEPRRGGS